MSIRGRHSGQPLPMAAIASAHAAHKRACRHGPGATPVLGTTRHTSQLLSTPSVDAAWLAAAAAAGAVAIACVVVLVFTICADMRADKTTTLLKSLVVFHRSTDVPVTIAFGFNRFRGIITGNQLTPPTNQQSLTTHRRQRSFLSVPVLAAHVSLEASTVRQIWLGRSEQAYTLDFDHYWLRHYKEVGDNGRFMLWLLLDMCSRFVLWQVQSTVSDLGRK